MASLNMESLFGWVATTFAVYWIVFFIRGFLKDYRGRQNFGWAILVCGALVVIGAVGFFGQMLLAIDVIKIPKSVEWPAGYVKGVIATQEGLNVVPLEPSGRVQVYDRDWHFLHGWHIDASGGSFKVLSTRPGIIEVFTGRGRRHFTYSEDGQLLASEAPYVESIAAIDNGGIATTVPTKSFLWPFSSPFLSWALVLIGFLGIWIIKKSAA